MSSKRSRLAGFGGGSGYLTLLLRGKNSLAPDAVVAWLAQGARRSSAVTACRERRQNAPLPSVLRRFWLTILPGLISWFFVATCGFLLADEMCFPAGSRYAGPRMTM
jgi:hypothetical protein